MMESCDNGSYGNVDSDKKMIDRVVQIIKEVFECNNRNLSDVIDGSMSDFVSRMNEESLSNVKDIHHSDFNVVIRQCMAGFPWLRSLESIEQRCSKIFDVLIKLGGPVLLAAGALKEDITVKVQKEFPMLKSFLSPKSELIQSTPNNVVPSIQPSYNRNSYKQDNPARQLPTNTVSAYNDTGYMTVTPHEERNMGNTSQFTSSRPTNLPPSSFTSGVMTNQFLHDSAISRTLHTPVHSTTNILDYTETESIGHGTEPNVSIPKSGHGTEPNKSMSGQGAMPSSNIPHEPMTNPRKGQGDVQHQPMSDPGHQPTFDPANDMYNPHSICHNCSNTFKDKKSHSFPSDKVDQHLLEHFTEVHKDDRHRAKNAETSVQCELREQLKGKESEIQELKTKVEELNEELKQERKDLKNEMKQRITDTKDIVQQRKQLDEKERIMEERERIMEERERKIQQRERMAEEREQQMEGGNPQQNIDKENGTLKKKEIVYVETLTPNTQ